MRNLIVILSILVITLSACSNQRPNLAAKVEPEKARTALTQTLDAWKAGKTPDDLKSRSPKIVAQDMDWQKGMKLTSYEIIGSGEALDANLECPVKLSLVGTDGNTVEKTVTYIVGTDPVLTVFRKIKF